MNVVKAYSARAEATGSYIDYGFHIIIVRNDADVLEHEIPVLMNEWGISSCKLFMTYETQRMTDSQLLDVMYVAKKNTMTTVSLLNPSHFVRGMRFLSYFDIFS